MRGSRSVALVLALSLAPGSVLARGQKPEDAAAKRDEIESGLDPTDPRAVVDGLEDAAAELGDPELFLRAATVARDEAAAVRDPELALRAEALALTARDIGLHLADAGNYAATDWRPVTAERAAELASEAEALADEAHALAEEIEAERAAAEAEAERARLAALEAENNKKRSKARPGTGLIAGGSVALVIGAGGIGMLAVGLARGASLQGEAEALALPAELPRLEELDRQGATANVIAGVGGALAAVGVGVGVALIVVGVKKRKAAGPSTEARRAPQRLLVGPWLEPRGGGLSVQGRF